jgi:hypothetical protein
MSDSNSDRKTAARQENKQLSFYEQGRSNFKDGLQKSAASYGKISQSSTPHTAINAAGQVGQAVLAGIKDYGQAAANFGKGFMQGVSQQNPSPGQHYNSNKIYQVIAEGKANANQTKQNQTYTPKANITNNQKSSQQISSTKQSNTVQKGISTNKGLESYQNMAAQSNQQKSAAAGKSSNKGITSFQSKTSGTSRSQSSNASKGSSSGSSRSSGSGGGKSGGSSSSSGSSSGGQSR